jgi:hypothetical protein
VNEVVNLNRARKDKARRAAKATAAEKRVKFGQSKVEKAAAERERASISSVLDGAKLDSE